MASPPQRNSNDPLKDLGSQQFDRRVGGGLPFRWTWLWIIILIGLICWFCGWGWGPYGGWWWGGRSLPAVHSGINSRAVDGQTGSRQIGEAQIYGDGTAILNASSKLPYVGHQFAISSVPVQETITNRTFWIGEPNETPMLVVVKVANAGAAGTKIANGDKVDVIGTVEKAPAGAAARQGWALNDADAARLYREGVYIQATQVRPAYP